MSHEPEPGRQPCDHPADRRTPDGLCPICLLQLLDQTEPDDARADGGDSPGHIGPYQILGRIGEGGMGIVHKARHLRAGHLTAIKLIRAGRFAGPRERTRFEVEARAVASLDHPNIVRIHSLDEHDGQPYLVMDYVEGRSLADFIQDTLISAAEAARHTRTIATAMHHAHQRGILHRDLKPANILIDSEHHLRITDFGLAKRIDADSDVTASGALIGTPAYMSPEQAAGARPGLITVRSDIHSIGATLYHLLTGRPPFRGDSREETLRQVREQDPVAPRLLSPGIPSDLEAVCLKCLEKDPLRRYATAQDLADDLGRFERGEPTRARPVGPAGRFWRWARREPVVAAFLGTAILLLALVAIALNLQIRDASESCSTIARLGATVIHDNLVRLEDAVATAAADPNLLAAVRSQIESGRSDLPRLLQKTFHQHQTNRANAVLKQANWMVVSTEGKVLARHPPIGGDRPSDDPGTRATLLHRDYLQGALQSGGRSPHVSSIYASVFETNPALKARFGVSSGLRDVHGNLLGILAAMVLVNDARQAFPSLSEGKQLAVVGPFDADRTNDIAAVSRTVMVMHPAFKPGDPLVDVSHPDLEKLVRHGGTNVLATWTYRDPMRQRNRHYGGWWLASFAPVPRTSLHERHSFVVICQSRNRAANALPWITPPLLAIGASILIRRHQARSRVPDHSDPASPADQLAPS